MWTARQIADMMWPLNSARYPCFVQDSIGGEIAETRNKIVKTCLDLERKTNFVPQSFFWVDDDVIFMKSALVKLYNHHVPIISGVYFTKTDPSEPLVFPQRLGGTLKFEPDKVIDVFAHAMGLTLISADVYRNMDEKGLPKDKYGNPEWYKTDKDFKFNDGVVDSGGTEDIYFCNLAHKLCGYQCKVDTSKHTFGFHYNYITKQGYPIEQYKQWAAGQPIRWPDGTVWD